MTQVLTFSFRFPDRRLLSGAHNSNKCVSVDGSRLAAPSCDLASTA